MGHFIYSNNNLFFVFYEKKTYLLILVSPLFRHLQSNRKQEKLFSVEKSGSLDNQKQRIRNVTFLI